MTIENQDTLFVRNWKPVTKILKYAGQRYVIERRGHREDTLALPVEAKKDKTISQWLSNGSLEEIDGNDFIELAARSVDGPVGTSSDDKPFRFSDKLKEGVARAVDIPIEGRNSSTPTVVANELFDKQAARKDLMSPKIEYADEPLTTKEELAQAQKAKPRASRAKKA